MKASAGTSATRLASLVVCGLAAGCEAIAGYSSREPWPLDADAQPIVSPYDDAATDAPPASDADDVLDLPDALVCSGGATVCSGACVDTRSDARNCGGCGLSCAADEYCDGASKCVCRPGLTSCGGQGCVDLATDPRNCGGCGIACLAGEACDGSACRKKCVAGRTACPLGDASACVTIVGSDPLNCGACGARCGGAQVCVAGVCQDVAPAVGCTSCPCDGCPTILGQPATCCAAMAGQAEPLCVAGTGC